MATFFYLNDSGGNSWQIGALDTGELEQTPIASHAPSAATFNTLDGTITGLLGIGLDGRLTITPQTFSGGNPTVLSLVSPNGYTFAFNIALNEFNDLVLVEATAPAPVGSPPLGNVPAFITSRFPAMVHVEYPLVPPQPSGFTVDAGNFQVPKITVKLPPDTRDIFGILVQDQRTPIGPSAITLVSDGPDIRKVRVCGQDAIGNYVDEVVDLNGTNPVTTEQIFSYILWANSSYGTILNETPAGAVDDTNKIYVLAEDPIPGSVTVYLAGKPLVLTVDYTITGRVITLVVAPPAIGGTPFVSCTYQIVIDRNVTISAGATLGILAAGELQWLANPILYRYENLAFGGSPDDPALTFPFVNSLQLDTHQFFIYFYNLLDELSLPFVANPNFVQPNQAGGSGIASVECLDVRNFGAKGDGIIDDTVAVQAAFDKAHQNWLAKKNRTGAPYGPSIVCVPSGVVCKVVPTHFDLLNRVVPPAIAAAVNPNEGDNNANDFIEWAGGVCLLMDDGITLKLDGEIIMGLPDDPAALCALIGSVPDGTSIAFIVIGNKNAWVNGPFSNNGLVKYDLHTTTSLFETGPRNTDILITGSGILDAGWQTYLKEYLVGAADGSDDYCLFHLNVELMTFGIRFCKADNSWVEDITIQDCGGIISWVYSDLGVVTNITGRDIHSSTTPSCATEMQNMRGIKFLSNTIKDWDASKGTGAELFSFAQCVGVEFEHNKITEGFGIQTVDIISRGQNNWELSKSYPMDTRIESNQIVNNRGQMWKPGFAYLNECVVGTDKAKYRNGVPHIMELQPNFTAYPHSGAPVGLSGLTEPEWGESAIGSVWIDGTCIWVDRGEAKDSTFVGELFDIEAGIGFPLEGIGNPTVRISQNIIENNSQQPIRTIGTPGIQISQNTIMNNTYHGRAESQGAAIEIKSRINLASACDNSTIDGNVCKDNQSEVNVGLPQIAVGFGHVNVTLDNPATV